MSQSNGHSKQIQQARPMSAGEKLILRSRRDAVRRQREARKSVAESNQQGAFGFLGIPKIRVKVF